MLKLSLSPWGDHVLAGGFFSGIVLVPGIVALASLGLLEVVTIQYGTPEHRHNPH